MGDALAGLSLAVCSCSVSVNCELLKSFDISPWLPIVLKSFGRERMLIVLAIVGPSIEIFITSSIKHELEIVQLLQKNCQKY